MLDTVTGNLALNSALTTFRSKGETKECHFFSFSKLFFMQNYLFFYHGDQKWRLYRWRAVNFEIQLCSFALISDCTWRSTIIQYDQTRRSRCRSNCTWLFGWVPGVAVILSPRPTPGTIEYSKNRFCGETYVLAGVLKSQVFKLCFGAKSIVLGKKLAKLRKEDR